MMKNIEFTKTQNAVAEDIGKLLGYIDQFMDQAKDGYYNEMKLTTDKTEVDIHYSEGKFFVEFNYSKKPKEVRFAMDVINLIQSRTAE